jgi:hypothetical protein
MRRWNETDYRHFWRAIDATARDADACDATRSRESSATCSHHVFVYDLSAPLSDFDVANATIASTFGVPLWTRDGEGASLSHHVRSTYQYSFSEALLLRLWRSPCRTLDPRAADVFFVPILPRAKNLKSGLRRACERLASLDLAPWLAHLTPCNARRHFFVLANEHVNGRSCVGWFAEPRGLLRDAVRIAHTHLLPLGLRDHPDALTYRRADGADAGLFATAEATAVYPNLISVPFFSSVHWRAAVGSAAGGAEPPWAGGGRHRLMLFLSSPAFLGANASATRDCSQLTNLIGRKSTAHVNTCSQFTARPSCEAHRVGATRCRFAPPATCLRDTAGKPCRPMRHAEAAHGDNAVRERIREQCGDLRARPRTRWSSCCARR